MFATTNELDSHFQTWAAKQDAMSETYYRTAYEHGGEAFQRGEPIEACGNHYWVGDPQVNTFGSLGVEGWRNGWKDAFCASLEPNWTDDASYAAYQGRD